MGENSTENDDKYLWYCLEYSIELNATLTIIDKFIYVAREEYNSYSILKCNGGLEMQSKTGFW